MNLLRKGAAIIAALVIAVGLFGATPAPAQANGSACGNPNGANYKGGYKSLTGHLVAGASVDIVTGGSGDYETCEPSDGPSQNAVVATVMVTNKFSGWVQMGLYRCVNDPRTNQVCNNTLRAFLEYRPASLAISTFVDLGPVAYRSTQSFKMSANDGSSTWNFFWNGVGVWNQYVSGLIAGESDNYVMVFGEILDNGDSVGTNVSGGTLNFGNLKYRKDTGTNYPMTTNCNIAMGYVACVKNGANGLYLYHN